MQSYFTEIFWYTVSLFLITVCIGLFKGFGYDNPHSPSGIYIQHFKWRMRKVLFAVCYLIIFSWYFTDKFDNLFLIEPLSNPRVPVLIASGLLMGFSALCMTYYCCIIIFTTKKGMEKWWQETAEMEEDD